MGFLIKLKYIWSKMFLKMHSSSIRNSNIDKTARPNSGNNIFNSSIGKYTYTGYDCWIIEAEIGSFCSLSNNVRIGGPSHPINFVSTSPVFLKGKNQLKRNLSSHSYEAYKKTIIGSDVWIGENAIVLAGVRIGDGTIVGAGSVVTKDIPPYEIWAGNPARLIRKRFDDEVIKELENIKWWNMSIDDIKNYSKFFNNPQLFISEFKKK